jgi:AAA15 family ATPase/GTPase
MLIEFTVKNFRSIRDEQTFTMEAFGSKFLLENNVGEVELAGGKKLHLLKSAVIYGANASGKSNLIKALYNLCFMVTESGSFKVGKGIACYEPFLLDKNSEGQPTYFKVTFVGKNTIKYVYEIAYNRDTIVSEKLDFYPNGKVSNLFKRYKEEGFFDLINYSSKLENKKNIKTQIISNQLFLSKFGENAHIRLTEIYQYFSEIIVGDALDKNDIKRLQENVAEEINRPKNNHLLMRLNNLIKIADTKIDSVSIKSIQDKLRPFAQHAIYEGDTIVAEKSFNVEEESIGTQVLFTLGFSILKVLDKGGVFIFDELDSSLHPQLSSFLVRLFHNTITNGKNAQIIFTTHEVLLLDKNTFRKDQIWFTEKDKTGATELFCANDFEGVRDDMPFDKWYLAGKFGGTPHIAESKFLLDYA